MPTGKVKWFDADKGFGFLTRDEGDDVFVHQSALPAGTQSLKTGQRVEFGVVEGRRGKQALQVQPMQRPPSVAKQRQPPEDMVAVVEDLIKLLDSVSGSLRRGHYPDARLAKKAVSALRGVADDLEP